MTLPRRAVALALLVAMSAAAAEARCGSDATIQRKLAQYGVRDVNVSALSDTQMAHICAALASGDTSIGVQRRLNAALRSN